MLLYISVCLRTRQDSISYSFIYIVQKLELETVDRDRGTMELLRSYTEITPKLWDWDYGRGTMELLRSYTEITPKLLRNWGTVELWNYSEVIPKLLRNYSEIMGLGLWPWNYGITPKLYRNYSEIEDRGTMELLRSYTEITPKLWDWDYGITPKLGNRGTITGKNY